MHSADTIMEPLSPFTKPSAMMSIAAGAVIVASAAAVGAVFGVIPSTLLERPSALAQSQDGSAGRAAGVDARNERQPGGEMKGRTVQATDGCANCGVVEAVRALQMPQTTGPGAVAGGVVGAAAGSQVVGRGNGRTVLGILGALGGAYGGNAIERAVRSGAGYRVTVRMEDGSRRSVYLPAAPAFVIGEKVRVVNGALAAQG